MTVFKHSIGCYTYEILQKLTKTKQDEKDVKIYFALFDISLASKKIGIQFFLNRLSKQPLYLHSINSYFSRNYLVLYSIPGQ